MFIDEAKNPIDAAIAEMTHVASEYVQEKVYLYGRQKWTGPTLHKASSVWVIWRPFAKYSGERVVTLIKGTFTATREGESPDHLIEMSRSSAMVLDLEEFVLPEEHVERIRQRIREQRGF